MRSPTLILKMPDDSIAPLLLALALTAGLRRAARRTAWWLAAAGGVAGLAGSDWSGCGRSAQLGQTAERSPCLTSRCSAACAAAGRQRRPALGAAGGAMVGRHRHRSGALRLSAVQLLLLRRPAARRRVAARAASGFALSLPNTVILLASSVAVWWGERGTQQGARAKQLLGLLIGIVLGAGLRRRPAVRMEEPSRSRLSSQPLRLALLHDHRLPHGARRGRADDPAGAPGLVGARLFRTASRTRRSRSARSTGISSTPSGSPCSSPST